MSNFINTVPEIKKILKMRGVQHFLFWSVMAMMYTINYMYAPGIQQRRFIDTFIFLPGHIFFAYTQMYWVIHAFCLKENTLLMHGSLYYFLPSAFPTHISCTEL